MKGNLILLVFVSACFSLVLFEGCSRMKTLPTNVDPAGASDVITANSKNSHFVLLDVRTPQEYSTSHIPGAVNIDVQSPSFRKSVEALDHSKTYLLYCRSGNRSSTAMDIMRSMGFGKVAQITGGITAWEKSGLRTIEGSEPGK
jgi:rhodanese-related sulfurtransferase